MRRRHAVAPAVFVPRAMGRLAFPDPAGAARPPDRRGVSLAADFYLLRCRRCGREIAFEPSAARRGPGRCGCGYGIWDVVESERYGT